MLLSYFIIYHGVQEITFPNFQKDIQQHLNVAQIVEKSGAILQKPND